MVDGSDWLDNNVEKGLARPLGQSKAMWRLSLFQSGRTNLSDRTSGHPYGEQIAIRTSAMVWKGIIFSSICYLDVPKSRSLRSVGAIGRRSNFIGHKLC